MRIFTDKYGTKYADLVIGGKRRRISLKTKDGKVAILRAGKLADDRQATNDGKVLLEAFLARYRTFLKAARSKKTAQAFENALRKLLDFRQIKYLQEITPALLDELAITLKADIPGTAAGLNRSIRALKTAMRQAEFWDIIPPQNWVKVSKFKENTGRVEFHTPKEIKKILDIVNFEWRVVVLLGCRAGLRRGEIAYLKWDHVDFKNNQIYVAPHKNEKYRYVPLDVDLRKALEKAAKTRGKQVYVVNVGNTEKRASKNYVSDDYRDEVVAYLPFHSFLHKLRHTFASHLVQAGVDLYRVKNLMGHSSIQMTERYAHLAPQDLKSAVKKLPKIN